MQRAGAEIEMDKKILAESLKPAKKKRKSWEMQLKTIQTIYDFKK